MYEELTRGRCVYTYRVNTVQLATDNATFVSRYEGPQQGITWATMHDGAFSLG